jgi:hypothetical protein
MESCAAPVQVCRAFAHWWFLSVATQKLWNLVPWVFYNLGIFTATATNFLVHFMNVKEVKQSCNRASVAQRVPGGLGSQISWHSTREGGEVVSLTHRLPLPPGIFLVLIFTRGWVDPRAMVRSKGNMSLKNPATPPGIDPGTVWLVAQRLNHYATPGPHFMNVVKSNLWYLYHKEFFLLK